jgi:hypothetical protein
MTTRPLCVALSLLLLPDGATSFRPPLRATVPKRPAIIATPVARSPPPSAIAAYDLPLGLAGCAILAVYQKISDQFTSQWSAQNAEGRAVWTRYILEKGDYILGVQTLRNALTSASFFSSACFTCLSLLIGIASQQTLSSTAVIKFTTTSLLLVGAALSYLQSVRYMNTCAFLFQVANDQRDETCSRGTVMLLMVLSQNCWAAGERFLYFLVPSIVWLAGGGALMLPFVLIFCPVLYYKDLPYPTNLLAEETKGVPDKSLVPYNYLLKGRFRFLDVFGFSTALSVAQATVAKSGDYAREKYGLESATWPPQRTAVPTMSMASRSSRRSGRGGPRMMAEEGEEDMEAQMAKWKAAAAEAAAEATAKAEAENADFAAAFAAADPTASDDGGAAAEGLDEAALDALVRKEVEACFAGLEDALATGDEKAALSLIQSQGKQVLGNVLTQLEEEGKLVSEQITKKVEAMATDQRTEVLKKYDEQLEGLQKTMAADRQTIREEMQALEKLNEEYKALQKPSFNKDKIIGGLAFVVGLTYVGSAINEALKIILGAGGDPLAIGLNGALGAAGIGYYFYRTGGEK